MSEEAQKAAEASEAEGQSEFARVKARLEEIADAVDDKNISLDDALDLYEEAVSLGLQASDLLEVGISPEESAEVEAESETPAVDGNAAGEAKASVSE